MLPSLCRSLKFFEFSIYTLSVRWTWQKGEQLLGIFKIPLLQLFQVFFFPNYN
uniref:Uncharacterized protein n=1 Tax=Rhizophora mucronata TaxID=61149 RepID=A0A2P2P8N2_RHIMU